MVNRGVAPLDPMTEVGQFRVRAGDINYSPLSPPEVGFGDYQKWSDLEIQAFLAATSSPSWAIYEAYLQIATSAALAAKAIKDYDLQVDTVKRADALAKIAALWRQRAEDEDAIAGLDDEFLIVPMGDNCEVIPELSIPIWGRKYVLGRVC